MCAIGVVLFVLMLLGLWDVATGEERYDEVATAEDLLIELERSPTVSMARVRAALDLIAHEASEASEAEIVRHVVKQPRRDLVSLGVLGAQASVSAPTAKKLERVWGVLVSRRKTEGAEQR